MPKPKRAIAVILSLFVLIVLGGFVSLAAYQYVSDRVIHQHYENSIRGLYAIEAVRNILIWEENHATPINSWSTVTTGTGAGTSSTNGMSSFPGTTIANGFYLLTGYNGYNIKAKVLINSGNVCMYIQAYKGEEANPEDAQYLEYIHSPSPMYKYAMFSNTNLTFEGSKLYNLSGGSIHTNGDLIFKPYGTGIRFSGVGQMTASGTIEYGQRHSYPAPHIIDDLDGSRDGMAPAPALISDHYGTTTGETLIPGPYRYWSTDSLGITSLATDWYGNWVADNWGSYADSSYPLIFRGEETYFYGKQTSSGSRFDTDEGRSYYIQNDGTYGYNPSNFATVNNYNFSNNSYETNSYGNYYYGDIYFQPYRNSDGNLNSVWFELPGSLPQTYNWNNANKYAYANSSESAVTFYVTESCTGGSSSCSEPSGSTVTGWRYRKYDKDGTVCTTDSCYTDPANATVYNKSISGGYVKAQDYVTGTQVSQGQYNSCRSSCWNGCRASWRSCRQECDQVYTETSAPCGLAYTSCTGVCGTDYDTCKAVCSADCDSDYTACQTPCDTDYATCMQGYDLCQVQTGYGCESILTTCSENRTMCSRDCTNTRSSCKASCSKPGSSCYTQKNACYTVCGNANTACLQPFQSNRTTCRNGCQSDYTACGGNCDSYCTNLATSDKNYYDNLKTTASDISAEFFGDYSYGTDIASGTYSTTTALNAQEQNDAFNNNYLSLLSNRGISGFIASGVDVKEPYLGSLFDATSSGDSAYKTKAQNGGIYLSTSDVSALANSTSTTLSEYASLGYFYNWKTAGLVTVINIDVEKLNTAIASGIVSFSNGIIYSEVPVMLSSAANLPGTNLSDKTAVFTLISEESVYLKGDYNTDENWEISSIATQKKVYTLSDAFNVSTSSSSAVLAETPAYPDYPYVKVSVILDENGKISSATVPDNQETATVSTSKCTAGTACVIWVNADNVNSTYVDPNSPTGYDYTYYSGMDSSVRTAVINKKTSLQEIYATAHVDTDVNDVNDASYDYNSLFITPYDIDVLESWRYQTGVDGNNNPTYAQATRNLTGAFINFYSNCGGNPDGCLYDDEYRKDLNNNGEICSGSSCSGGFFYGTRNSSAARNSSLSKDYLYYAGIQSPNTVQSYDDRFPTATPTSSEGVLGFTGQDSWRFISKEYFINKTS